MVVSATTIHIQVLGQTPSGTRRLSFSESPITFGRSPDSTIILLDNAVSRQHGELRYVDGEWLLVNLSANGTRLSGKRITTKPRKLQAGDEVSVEDVPLFRVSFADAAHATGNGGDEEPPAAAAKKKMSGRAKLWTGIGAYLGLMVIVLIIGMFYRSDKDANAGFPPLLTDEQIETEVRKPVTGLNESPELAAHRLVEAKELFYRQESSLDALYRSHRAFKESLAYSNRSKFAEGLDHQLYDQAETELIAKVTQLNRDAGSLLTARSYPEAEKLFARLQAMYPDAQSIIYRNAVEQQAAIKRLLGERSGRGL